MESFNLNLPVSTSSLSFDYADRDLPEWGTPILSEEEILSPTTPVGPVGDAEFDPSSNAEDDVPLLEFLSRQENVEDNAIALLLENTCVTGSDEEMSMANDSGCYYLSSSDHESGDSLTYSSDSEKTEYGWAWASVTGFSERKESMKASGLGDNIKSVLGATATLPVGMVRSVLKTVGLTTSKQQNSTSARSA